MVRARRVPVEAGPRRGQSLSQVSLSIGRQPVPGPDLLRDSAEFHTGDRARRLLLRSASARAGATSRQPLSRVLAAQDNVRRGVERHRGYLRRGVTAILRARSRIHVWAVSRRIASAVGANRRGASVGLTARDRYVRMGYRAPNARSGAWAASVLGRRQWATWNRARILSIRFDARAGP